MDPEAAFKEVIKRSGTIFREHGFKGSGQNFKRDCGETWQGINFQKSQWRLDKSEPVSFYINICIHFAAVKKERYNPPAPTFDKYTPMKSDLQLRAGDFMEGGDDLWLTVNGTEADLETFWKRYAAFLTQTLMPALNDMRTPAGLERILRRVPWMAIPAAEWLAAGGRPIRRWETSEKAQWKQDEHGLWWFPGERKA